MHTNNTVSLIQKMSTLINSAASAEQGALEAVSIAREHFQDDQLALLNALTRLLEACYPQVDALARAVICRGAVDTAHRTGDRTLLMNTYIRCAFYCLILAEEFLDKAIEVMREISPDNVALVQLIRDKLC